MAIMCGSIYVEVNRSVDKHSCHCDISQDAVADRNQDKCLVVFNLHHVSPVAALLTSGAMTLARTSQNNYFRQSLQLQQLLALSSPPVHFRANK